MVVKFLAFVLGVYSFVFHLTLSVFLLGIAIIAYRTHQQISLSMLPFDDEQMLRNTAILGLVGIFCTLFALSRWFKFVFVIWTLAVLYLLVNGFFMGPYTFHGSDEMRGATWLTFGAIGAFFGAAWSLKARRRTGFL